MTTSMAAIVVITATPFLGALVGLFLWRKPQDLRSWLLLVSAISLATAGWAAALLPVQAGGVFLLLLLPLMAFATLLGQPVHESNAVAWLQAMIFLGLGLCVLAAGPPLSRMVFFLLFSLIVLLLFRHRHQAGRNVRWAVATAVLGMLAIVLSLVSTPPISSIAFGVACAIALPLMPFHTTYVVALAVLPGNLPAFLALLLPVVGFHGLMTVLPQLPNTVTLVAAVLALVAMLYGSLKALAQIRAVSIAAYGSLVLLSILWWYLATIRTIAPSTVVYVSAVGVAMSGLLLSWHMLRARYGEIGVQTLSGLAQPMPRFAIALSLVSLAALGFPPFGIFSGFMGMLFSPPFVWSGGLIVVIIAWLTASWYFFAFVQGLLFGGRPTDYRHEDLREHEFVSLLIVLVLLVVLGVMPSRMFDVGTVNVGRTSLTEVVAWTE